MLSIKSRVRVHRPGADLFVLRTSFGRRALFAVLAVVLLVGLIGGATPADFTAGRLGGTLFYLCLLVVCLLVAGWDRQIWFDRRAGAPRPQSRTLFFFIPIGRRYLSETAPASVVVQYLHMLRDEELGQGNPVSRRISSYMVKRSSMFKLQVETDEDRVTLEDSSDRAELEQIAATLADFLNVPYRFEEM